MIKILKKDKFLFLLVTGYLLLITSLTGCAPTYPKEKFTDSIIKICKDEYKFDVKVATTGKTVAIYLPLQELWDSSSSLTKEAAEKINHVILSVSRVALSTNAKYDFYIVIAQDLRVPDVQIIIVKSVDDVKKFWLNAISLGEFSKRMLIDKRISPQAKKEHVVKEAFEKMNLDEKWQDSVMNDFFRSQPATLEDIGYWAGRFYIKDISLPEFLAAQIASRMKIEFFENKTLSETVVIKSKEIKNG